MNDEARSAEAAMREAAESMGEVVPESGQAIAGRSIPQMVSVRLDPALVRALRETALATDSTMSDVLRRAVVKFVESSQARQRFELTIRQVFASSEWSKLTVRPSSGRESESLVDWVTFEEEQAATG
jgi:uncharacterized protein (DUF4415 family)